MENPKRNFPPYRRSVFLFLAGIAGVLGAAAAQFAETLFIKDFPRNDVNAMVDAFCALEHMRIFWMLMIFGSVLALLGFAFRLRWCAASAGALFAACFAVYPVWLLFPVLPAAFSIIAYDFMAQQKPSPRGEGGARSAPDEVIP